MTPREHRGGDPGCTVPEALLRTSRECPESAALVSASSSLTYLQTITAAGAVSRALGEAGAGPEERVAVLVRRDLGSVVALLGVMLSGAAYVPLDAQAPATRLRDMVEQGGVRLLLAPESTMERARDVVADTPTRVVLPGPPRLQGPVHAELTHPPHPDDLAYVVFTSGSTGHPKGVEVTHRQLWAATMARFDFPDPGLDLLLLPLMFDAAAGGLYWALSRGGGVLLPDDAEVRDPVRLGALVRRFPVTHVNATPSLYSLLLDALASHRFDGLVYVDVGGEVLPPQLVGRHARLHPDTPLWNCYGPTEATVWATTFRCSSWHAVEHAVPLGGPVRDYQVAVLGEDLRCVAEGDEGELYIGGPGVARGYAGDPRLTAELFLPDPLSPVPGARRYRTGDVVRARRDQEGKQIIDFLGRRDDMVKVRGHRIELGEVERALREHPDVQEAVVVHVSVGCSSQLRAAVVLRGPHIETSAEQVASWLRGRLPSYMTPRISLVDSLPRTASGKLDRVRVRADLAVGDTPAPAAGPTSIARLDEPQLDAWIAALEGRPTAHGGRR